MLEQKIEELTLSINKLIEVMVGQTNPVEESVKTVVSVTDVAEEPANDIIDLDEIDAKQLFIEKTKINKEAVKKVLAELNCKRFADVESKGEKALAQLKNELVKL